RGTLGHGRAGRGPRQRGPVRRAALPKPQHPPQEDPRPQDSDRQEGIVTDFRIPFKSCILRGFLLSVAILLIAGSSYAQGALSSETYDLNFSKGLAEFESRRYDSAEKFFRKALEAKPGDPQATFYLGHTLTRAPKYGAPE